MTRKKVHMAHKNKRTFAEHSQNIRRTFAEHSLDQQRLLPLDLSQR